MLQEERVSALRYRHVVSGDRCFKKQFLFAAPQTLSTDKKYMFFEDLFLEAIFLVFSSSGLAFGSYFHCVQQFEKMIIFIVLM